MYDSNSKGISWTGGFFMLICFTVAGFIVASLISVMIWTGMTNLPLKEMEQGMFNPANANAIKMMQLITALIAFLLPALLTAFLLNRKPMLLLGFTRKINWKQVGVVIAIMVTALFVSAFLSYVNERIPLTPDLKEWFDKLENDYNRQVQAILGLNNAMEFVIAIVVMAFLPALCEEALFRGGLQNFLTRATRLPWLSIILVSLIFSIAHFSFYGLLSRLFLGIILGLIYHYSGRLWLCIIAHFINNALAITVLYFYKQKGVSLEQAIAESNSTWIGVFALPVLIALVLLFIRLADRRWMKDLA